MNRYEYFLKLVDYAPLDVPLLDSKFQIRTVQKEDVPALAELMIAAYRGTIDYDGETYEDALGEVKAFMAGERGGAPWLDLSYVVTVDSQVVGACLVGEWQARNLPLIAYVMTSAEWKNHGLSHSLLIQTLQSLKQKGTTEVRAVITEGNTPSENLFLKNGFQRIV